MRTALLPGLGNDGGCRKSERFFGTPLLATERKPFILGEVLRGEKVQSGKPESGGKSIKKKGFSVTGERRIRGNPSTS